VRAVVHDFDGGERCADANDGDGHGADEHEVGVWMSGVKTALLSQGR
jgi:hypothetical protein